MSELAQKIFSSEGLIGIPTGFPKLDKVSGGIRKGTVTVLGAGTGVGKSLFVLNILVNLAKQDKKVCYFDLENSERVTFQRLIRMWFQLNEEAFLIPDEQKTFEDKEREEKMVEEVREAFTYWDEETLLKWEDNGMGLKGFELVLSLMKNDHQQNQTDLYIIDPLQSLESETDSFRAFNQQGDIIKKLRIFAQTCNTAVLICHHFRKSMGNPEKIKSFDELNEVQYPVPTLESFKGSGKIVETATDVWGLMRTYASEDKGQSLLSIIKSREKDRVNVPMRLDLDTLTFTEGGGELFGQFRG